MVKGSCCCGKIKYEISGEIYGFKHCHCYTCRKITGTAYASSAVTASAGFTITEGKGELTGFLSSPGKTRNFCRNCGSQIYAIHDNDTSFVILRVGTIDNFPSLPLEAHIWISQKAPWYDITGDAPKYLKGFPS